MKKSISIMLIFLHLSFGICHLSFASEYELAPHDQLEIKIVGKPDLATKQTITPDGTLSLPLIGRIEAEGLTLKQLDEYLTAEFSKYIEKPQIIVYLTARPIYIIQHDIKKNVWDVKEAKSVAEAQAYLGKPTSNLELRTSNIQHGDVVSVEVSKKPDFWEENWYKIITATAVVVGIYATLHR